MSCCNCETSFKKPDMQFEAVHPNFKLPSYATDGSGAFDIYATEDVTLSSKDTVLVDLGFKAAIPEGHAALILPRSGLGHKHGTRLRNTVGFIDVDYRGHWMASLLLDDVGYDDPSNKERGRCMDFKAGERIVQIAVVPITQVNPVLVDSLDDTERGAGGFGHTGR